MPAGSNGSTETLPDFTYSNFCGHLDTLLDQLEPVSRETGERLKLYGDLLIHWNRRTNLVARSTISNMWHRHFLDSAQLAKYLTKTDKRLVDLGSGAGFPGLVLAALLPGLDIHLVESDTKKCVFLRQAARLMDVAVTVHRQRIEDIDLPATDVITARALAPLPKLLPMVTHLVTDDTRFLLPKGLDVDTELTQAAKCWKMAVLKHSSITSPDGVILELRKVKYDRTNT